MHSTDKSVAIALERARENVQKLEQLDTPINDAESWSAVIVQSLAFHREQRTYWRNLVHDLPAHLKVWQCTPIIVVSFQLLSYLNWLSLSI